MAFLATPTDGSSTPIPMSSVVPDGTNTPTALEGGPAVSSGGNNLAPASMYVKDGNDVTLGAKADAAQIDPTQAATVIALLKGLLTELIDIEAQTTTTPVVSGTVAVSNFPGTQPVSGTVTANAGTNLNTSALALESGGNLATLAGAISAGSMKVNVQNGNANGQTTMANSSPVTIASDQSAVKIKPDFNEQAALVAGSLNADLVASFDVSAYEWFALQVTGTWSGTLTVAGSNDNTNFITCTVNKLGSVATTTSAITTNDIYFFPKQYRYLRVRMTAYTSGTANGVLESFTMPSTWQTLYAILGPGVNGIGNVNAAPRSSGGTNDFHLISAATNNATSIKASGGQVYGYEIYNTNAAVRYVKLYNKASAPAPATDTPFRTIAVPPSGRASFHSSTGLAMGTGIAIATTTGIADNDNTSVGASDLSIDIDWI